jgi:putative ATP-dependent endonuclease of the OLD family
VDFDLTPVENSSIRRTIHRNPERFLRVTIQCGQEVSVMSGYYTKKRLKLNSEMASHLARFIGERLDCPYIPSVRTARSARNIVEDLVARELTTLEQDSKYVKALALIERLQRPVLKKISSTITQSLRDFLPSVKKVKVTIPRENRSSALRRSCNITVDDGVETNLQHKGDGIQSLAALSLIRFASLIGAQGRQLVLAVEEPETHLHPSAIHQLRGVLQEIAQDHQVIITTHNPLFVAREKLGSNIIVLSNQAAPATSMEQIRDTLGVKPTDNLQHAELVLLVEGDDDKTALTTILPVLEPALAADLAAQLLVIEPTFGATKLAFRLQQLQLALCPAHALLDNDDEGRKAYNDAQKRGLLRPVDAHFITCKGMKDSEIEDTYRTAVYSKAIQDEFGVDLKVSEFRGNRKWSERMKAAFQAQGKQWDDAVRARAKLVTATSIANDAKNALIPQKSTSLNALAKELVAKLARIRQKTPRFPK